MKKILISAFMPFNKFINNYSKEVLDYINTDKYIINKVVIDVIYDKCFLDLSAYNLADYDLIIALGEARSRVNLTIEKNAKNISSCSIADNIGNIKQNEIIIEKQSEVLISNLNIDKCDKIASISLDAGKFVCNNLYFHLLNYNPNKCLFIHIPECHNDTNLYKKYASDIIKIIDELMSPLV